MRLETEAAAARQEAITAKLDGDEAGAALAAAKGALAAAEARVAALQEQVTAGAEAVLAGKAASARLEELDKVSTAGCTWVGGWRHWGETNAVPVHAQCQSRIRAPSDALVPKALDTVSSPLTPPSCPHPSSHCHAALPHVCRSTASCSRPSRRCRPPTSPCPPHTPH